jgi:hypothetical protein
MAACFGDFCVAAQSVLSNLLVSRVFLPFILAANKQRKSESKRTLSSKSDKAKLSASKTPYLTPLETHTLRFLSGLPFFVCSPTDSSVIPFIQERTVDVGSRGSLSPLASVTQRHHDGKFLFPAYQPSFFHPAPRRPVHSRPTRRSNVVGHRPLGINHSACSSTYCCMLR